MSFVGSDRYFLNVIRSSGTLVVWPPSLCIQVFWRDVFTGQQFLPLGGRVPIPGPRARGAYCLVFVLLRPVFDWFLCCYEGHGEY